MSWKIVRTDVWCVATKAHFLRKWDTSAVLTKLHYFSPWNENGLLHNTVSIWDMSSLTQISLTVLYFDYICSYSCRYSDHIHHPPIDPHLISAYFVSISGAFLPFSPLITRCILQHNYTTFRNKKFTCWILFIFRFSCVLLIKIG